MTSMELRGTRAPGRGGRDRPDFSSRRSGGGGNSGGGGGTDSETGCLSALVLGLPVVGTAIWGVVEFAQVIA